MRIKVSGLKEYTVAGKAYRYHRASGTRIDPALKGNALILEIDRLDKLHAVVPAKPGTLGGLFESWRKVPAFTDLKPRTRSDYLNIMDYLRPLADTPLVVFTTGHVAKLRDKTLRKKRAGFTNHMLAMLSSAFKHGLEYELVEKNPVPGLAKAKMTDDRKRNNRAWTPDERRNVIAIAPTRLRLPLLLARSFGMRRGDIVAVRESAYSNGWLTLRAGKNNALLRLPVLGRLRAEIEAMLAQRPAPTGNVREMERALCLNSRGRGWTADSLSSQIDRFLTTCRERGIMGHGGSLHGLRHSVGAELRAAGYTAEQRKLILGHDTDEMAEHYSASADVTGQLIDMATVLQGRAEA